MTRTSQSHPLQIATITVPGTAGAIGVTLCPGKKDPQALTGSWDRDLELDVASIVQWGGVGLVCLMKPHELVKLKVVDLRKVVTAAGLHWFHLPIRDVDVPDAGFEEAWSVQGPQIRDLIAAGQSVIVHCRGGLGRSGTIAARLLVEFGVKPSKAIALIRKQRPGAIETQAQEAYVRALVAPPQPTGEPVKALDRAVGCLVGLAVGDALGTTLEFKPRDSYPPHIDMVGGGPFNMKPGEWTDDTSMALCLVESLLEHGKVEPTDLMQRFHRWHAEGHNSVKGYCFDIGITTRQAIARFIANGKPIAGSKDGKAAGNGSIMRLAPVPIFYHHDLERAEKEADLQSRTTHGAEECLESCRLMSRVLVNLISGQVWQSALTAELSLFKTAKVRALAAGQWKGKARSDIRSSGYVIDTLEAGFWAVDGTSSYEEAILLAANLGDDADTVGAVAGQLAGARYGVGGIPKNWLLKLAWREKIEGLAKNLFNAASGT